MAEAPDLVVSGACYNAARVSIRSLPHEQALLGSGIAVRLVSGARARPARHVSVHARHSADDVSRTAVDDAAVRRLRDRRGIESAISVPSRPRRHWAERRVRSADADGLRLGSCAGRRRGRARRCRDRFDRGHGGALRRHSARPGVDVDDYQRDGDRAARSVRRGGAPAGRRSTNAVGHDSERHPEGVCRARHLHLSASRVAAHRDRHLRVLRARAAELEHDLDQRLSHSRGWLDRRTGSGIHVRQRHRLRGVSTAGGARRQQLRTAAVVLLQRAQRFSRRDREVPGGAAAVGADHARTLRRDAARAPSNCASTPRRPAAP